MKRLVAAALISITVAAVAAPPDKLVQRAGPPPSDAAARAAMLKYAIGRDSSFDKRKPYKVLSGPTLATGNTFGGGIEQAWLMCVVVNAIRTSPGPSDIEGKSIYLRTSKTGEVFVVPIENWKDSSPQCGGDK